MDYILYVLIPTTFVLEVFSVLKGLPGLLRRALAVFAAIVTATVFTVVLVWDLNFWTILLGVIAIYRILNNARVVKSRMNEKYLRRVTLQTSAVLGVMQALVVLAWATWNASYITKHMAWGVVAGAQLLVGAIYLTSTVRTMRRTAWAKNDKYYSDHDLPSVTVAIPARNETEDLQECLRSLIASDYPKMEIIVLDDCSQDKRTPEIIRDFAHDGVRFVQCGGEPSEAWLAKNAAYNRLAQEAAGELIIFCGVDARFEPYAIRQLVSGMLGKHKKMMSILPKRSPRAYAQGSIIQAMRYWWELVPPRRAFHRPPVLSSCWIIRADELKKSGGFASVYGSIAPEAHFARFCMRDDGYSFMRSSDALGISSEKTTAEQRDTAVRMRYPQMHRRPEQVLLLSAFEILLFILPWVIAIGGFWLPFGWAAQVLALGALILSGAAYEIVILSTKVNSWWLGLVAAPAAFITDIAMLHWSLWRYEFGSVDWRGRNICIPVMRTIPRLPPLQ